jgi:hypothetical protein
MWKKEKRPWSLKNSFDSSKQKVYIELTGEGATGTLFYTTKKIPMGRAKVTHKQPLKPALKLENKIARLKFCISMFDQTTITDAKPFFVNMHSFVHIDEKWFDMTKRKKELLSHAERTRSPTHYS